jgi:signal peptidase I
VSKRGVTRLAIVTVVAGACAGVAARAVGLYPMRVASGSMAKAVDRGDWIVVRSLGARAHARVERGDIVLFRYPLGTSGRAIKRVIAVGGDRVAYSTRSVTVNGRTRAIGGAPARRLHGTLTVPDGQVFLLGDHAAVSIDSRSFGPVPDAQVVGHVVAVSPGSRTLALIAVAVLAALAAPALRSKRGVHIRSSGLQATR